MESENKVEEKIVQIEKDETEIVNKEEKPKNNPLVPVQQTYKKVGFIVNPVAGKGRVFNTFESEVLPKLKQKFKNFEICCYLTKKKGDGNRLAKKYIKDGFDVIVSVGKFFIFYI